MDKEPKFKVTNKGLDYLKSRWGRLLLWASSANDIIFQTHMVNYIAGYPRGCTCAQIQETYLQYVERIKRLEAMTTTKWLSEIHHVFGEIVAKGYVTKVG